MRHSARAIPGHVERLNIMAVLIEGLSVVILREAIDGRYVGGWSRLLEDMPSRAFCADDSLLATAFAVPTDVKPWVSVLQVRGLRFLDGASAVDFAIVHQWHGPTSRCDWLRFGRVRTALPERLSACHHVDSTSRVIVVPGQWSYEQSIARQFGDAEPSQELARLDYLRHHDGREAPGAAQDCATIGARATRKFG